ncbi:hypothetical protein [Epilithonimonas arachidiradicis]|uniref:Uncharacterized protein n=1 Tax=Epilithonimonas arachidiradicis TaxID=1617282 RepID=A0A420DB72_9FLAO|nr:hypothetical protein [Epilithonimonas arachidiradicis]RKE88396.1 hypothetical protein BXY58_1547 [Epilithonimonas arachidiradicis]GGG49212.1 hypothetical protein GCM10007332_08430 [Epilithonimonas arachidiradicis]
MNEFISKEIKNLKKLRLTAIGFLVLVNFAIIGCFVYLFYEVYVSRDIQENFISYIFPTVFYLQLVLALGFGPPIIIIHRRFRSVINELADLNDEFVIHYQNYIRLIQRLMTVIPLYLFSQKGLLVFMNFKTQLIHPNTINFIKIKRVNFGRFRRCSIYLYQDKTLISKITYHKSHPAEAEFLKQNTHLINKNGVRIED